MILLKNDNQVIIRLSSGLYSRFKINSRHWIYGLIQSSFLQT